MHAWSHSQALWKGEADLAGSDNGTNFVDAAREFRKIATQGNQTLFHKVLAQQKVVWKLNLIGRQFWRRLETPSSKF